ncbi:hypothetical protein [Tateyamaria sp.]|uniref:hypothetical protein n=1 Tax=Tateyamaria sp. TaxID=1929288 RepID=UPI003B21BA08
MFTWLITSRFGRAAALAAGVLLAFFAVRRSGYRAAQEDRAIQDANAALDVRGRADEAMRRAEGDNRPLDDRLAEHGRLRDD